MDFGIALVTSNELAPGRIEFCVGTRFTARRSIGYEMGKPAEPLFGVDGSPCGTCR
jgi:hypothetical protein